MTTFKDFPKTGSRQTVVSGPRRSVLIVVACKCAYLAQHLLCLYFVVCVINIGCNLNLVLYPTMNMICVQCKPFLKHTAGKEDGGRRRDTSSKRREKERERETSDNANSFNGQFSDRRRATHHCRPVRSTLSDPTRRIDRRCGALTIGRGNAVRAALKGWQTRPDHWATTISTTTTITTTTATTNR